MSKLLKNIRFYVLLTSIISSQIIYVWAITFIPSEQLQIIRLTQIYALTAFTLLYIALLAGPFCHTFINFPYIANYLKARRAIGVSAFYFALLHACFAFFGQLGGFAGLNFLSNNFLTTISLSFISLIILFLMSITSFDLVIRKMTIKKWKLLHRCVYLAGIFILIHALMLGTHFMDLSKFIPQVMLFAVGFLLILEARRIDSWISEEYTTFSFGPSSVITSIILTVFLMYSVSQNGDGITLGIHAEHLQLAKENNTAQAEQNGRIPSLTGNKTKRYNTSFTAPENPLPETEIPLSFAIYNSASGEKEKAFLKLYEKPIHLIIVDESLSYFYHIHPEQSENIFSITTSFPKSGKYHLYVDYQPVGAIEQQNAFTLQIGTEVSKKSNILPDKKFTKEVKDYSVTLDFKKPIFAKEVSLGKKQLTFTLRNRTSNTPATNLMPYLGAYGHLVMINTKTFEYTHVHPLRLSTQNKPSGPTVSFVPMGLYAPIKPGTYKIFTQFNPNNMIITADFILEIK